MPNKNLFTDSAKPRVSKKGTRPRERPAYVVSEKPPGPPKARKGSK